MSDANVNPLSRREAVQPSLWDRLVDDLPGLVAETRTRQRDLERELGSERLEALLAGGRRAMEQDADLTDEQRKSLAAFVAQMERRGFLEQRGIVVTADVLREAVRRDIEMLFNIERMEAGFLLSDTELDRADNPADLVAGFPRVRRSVLNYGVPAFAGRRARDFDAEKLSRELKEVIAVFEPRLKRDTIRVRVTTGDKTGLRIGIEAVLMLSPVPERLRLSTSVDLDNGRATTRIEGA